MIEFTAEKARAIAESGDDGVSDDLESILSFINKAAQAKQKSIYWYKRLSTRDLGDLENASYKVEIVNVKDGLICKISW